MAIATSGWLPTVLCGFMTYTIRIDIEVPDVYLAEAVRDYVAASLADAPRISKVEFGDVELVDTNVKEERPSD